MGKQELQSEVAPQAGQQLHRRSRGQLLRGPRDDQRSGAPMQRHQLDTQKVRRLTSFRVDR